jgi:hypothetical protein
MIPRLYRVDTPSGITRYNPVQPDPPMDTNPLIPQLYRLYRLYQLHQLYRLYHLSYPFHPSLTHTHKRDIER